MTKHPTPNMSQPTSSTFKVGDRVRTESGVACTVHHLEIGAGLVCVHKDNGYTGYLHPSQLAHRPAMSPQARTLLAAWHASGRTLNRVDRPTSANRANINWGRAIRRYCTPDLSIDLTIATEAK